VLVCLGATAAQTMLGRDFRITKHRGEFFPGDEVNWITATYHPSAVLRAPEKADRDRMRAEFVEDLRRAAERILQPIGQSSKNRSRTRISTTS